MHWWLTERGKKTQIGMELMGLDVSTSLIVGIPLTKFALLIKSVENVTKYNPDTGQPYPHPVEKYILQVGNRSIPTESNHIIGAARHVVSDPDINGESPRLTLDAGRFGTSASLEIITSDSNSDDAKDWWIGRRLAKSGSNRSAESILAGSASIEEVVRVRIEVGELLTALGVLESPSVVAVAHFSY